MSGRRLLTLGIIPTAILTAVVLPLVLAWSGVPEPMAVHWGLDGGPNGSLPRLVDLAVMVGIFGAAWWAVTGAIGAAPHEAPSYTAGLYFIGGLLVAVQWVTVAANDGAVEWTAASAVSGLGIVIIVIAGIGGGVAGWLLAERVSAPDPQVRPVLPLANPQGAVWSSQGRGPVLTVTGVGLIIAGLFFWGWTTVAFAVIGLGVLAFAQVRATVSGRGVVVSMGWFGIPSWTVPITNITAAQVERISPMAYGGWGYRIRPGVRAVIVRGGDSLRLERSGRADLLLTVDDPETGAGLINALVQEG